MEITYKRRPSGQLGSKPNFTVELTAILGVILPKNSSSSVFWKKYRNKYRFVCNNLGKKQNSTPYLAEMWSRFPDHRGSRKIGSIFLGKISLSKNKLWLNNLVLDFVNNQFFFYSTSVSWIFSEDLFRISLWKYYSPELTVQKVRLDNIVEGERGEWGVSWTTILHFATWSLADKLKCLQHLHWYWNEKFDFDQSWKLKDQVFSTNWSINSFCTRSHKCYIVLVISDYQINILKSTF